VDHINGERYYTDKPGIQDFLDKYSPSCVWFVGSPLPLWYDGTSPSPSDIRDLHAYQIVLAQLFPNGYTVNGKGVIPGISGASIVDYHEPRVITGTDVYHIGRLYIKILNPGQTLVSNDINNDSLAMQFIWDGKVKLMYLSDTLYPTQDAILRKKDAGFFDDADLKADIMCIGHHGLADGLSEGFLDAVSPRYAFAQSDIGIVDSIKAMLTARNIAAYEPYTMNRNIIFKCNDTISILPDIPIASYNFQR
jgi:hypothetical protein